MNIWRSLERSPAISVLNISITQLSNHHGSCTGHQHQRMGSTCLSTTMINGSARMKYSSEWPVSEKYYSIIQRAIKKQGDPLEKPGIVGAWCRTYTIHEVIDLFLSDVYDPCDMPDRYTYKEGSTSGGLVAYEDKYAY